MGRLCQFLLDASTSAAWWPGCDEFALGGVPSSARPPKVVLVVAHPDDESECAGTLYRISHELGGIVDQVIVTNGEGGQRFAAPALDYYGLSRNKEISCELPRLRKQEARRAGRVIGIRNHYFLEQKDSGFTLDPAEAIQSWDVAYVRRKLHDLFKREQYDLVITLLPSEDTHGHHKAVAVLALDVAASLPMNEQPAVAGVCAGSPVRKCPSDFSGLSGYPATLTTTAEPFFVADRSTRLAENSALDHSIIVHWVIAEHKSQGLFQMEYGRHTHEYFWQFAIGRKRWKVVWPWFRALGEASRQTVVEAA